MKKAIPKIPYWLLKRLNVFGIREGYTGDIEEEFEERVRLEGKRNAILWIWFHAIVAIPRALQIYLFWGGCMFRNYLMITLRNIRKHKGYSFINIAGLAVGMACSVLIFLWIQDMLSYDTFHDQSHRLYRVHLKILGDNRISFSPSTPSPLGKTLKEIFPEVTHSSRFTTSSQRLFQYGDLQFYEDGFCFVDHDFLEMFNFPLIAGDPTSMLTDPYSIVISEEMANKYFAGENPLGKTLRVDNEFDLTVTGLINNKPHRTNLTFNCLVPVALYPHLSRNVRLDDWGDVRFQTHIRLGGNTSRSHAHAFISHFLEKYDSENRNRELFLLPLRNIHLYNFDGASNDGIFNLYFLGALGILILLVACINFINLSTARSSIRAKEVGLRKVIGAKKSQITKQFFGESILFSFFALFISIIIILCFLPIHNSVSGRQLTFDLSNHAMIFFGLLGIALLTGIISGIYPALYLAAFQPISVLKGVMVKKGRGGKGFRLRKLLVVFQFTFSILLLILTFVLSRQIRFMMGKDIGQDDRNIVCFRMQDDVRTKYPAFKNELLRHPSVISVTASKHYPRVGISLTTTEVDWDGKDPNFNPSLSVKYIHHDFFKTVNVELVQGQSFSATLRNPTQFIILNETAAEPIGFDSPVGCWLSIGGEAFNILGVVKNYHFQTVAVEIKPLILRFSLDACQYISVKIASTQDGQSAALNFLKSKWETFVPDRPFVPYFLDEIIRLRYEEPKKFLYVFHYFMVFAIFISCLGLLGLSAYTSEQRRKEIGIRKVLGSSTGNIVLLLSKEFAKWVLIANGMGWALGFLLMTWGMQFLPYRIGIGADIFFITGVLTLTAAIVTVGYQSIKAAMANPVDSLRYE